MNNLTEDEDDFDKFVERLQQEIIDEETKAYNKYVVDLFHNPRNWGKPPEEEITISQEYKGPCGDTMQFFFKIEDGIIKKINFITDGCGISVAAGCQTTLLIEEKPIEYAEQLKSEDIETALHGLPDDHKHCAELAVQTLKRAIEIYKNNKV